MFGLGKKKSPPEADRPLAEKAAITQGAPAPDKPRLEISDDRFVVMPEEYLPKGAPPSGGNKKIYWLGAGAAVFLFLLAAGLYFFLFVQTKGEERNLTVTPPPVAPEPSIDETATTTTESLKVITSEAYDTLGQLLGSLRLTLPKVVANQYGESLGITALRAGDLDLPTQSTLAGGIYSLYPIGAVFAEPVAAELSAASLTTPESRLNYYPAYWRGTVWQEINAAATGNGWSFNFDKFPAGPITLVERVGSESSPVGATSTAPVLGATAPRASADTDGDGLTDLEEALLATNTALPDTDGDSYSDQAEIFGNYSPLLPKEKLENANLFALYTNPTYGYKAPYPKKWLADSLDETNKQVLFISATEEFFEILVEDNPLQKPIVDWYRSQSPALANAELDVTVVDGAAGVWSPDKLTLYLGKNGLVFILTYNKGTLEEINWPTFFGYFYKNFRFGNTTNEPSAPST